MLAIKQPCDRSYLASKSSGVRELGRIRWIVLHSTETEPGTAKAVARYFHSAGAEGSAHLVVDDGSCFGCLPDTAVPWAAPPLNETGFHIEQVGKAAWSLVEWMAHEDTIERAAYKASLRCDAHGIPQRMVTALELRGGVTGGVTTHAAISAAFHKSDHYDPGQHYPRDVFMRWLAHYRRLAA